MRHLQVFLEEPEQVHTQEQVLRLKLELCFSVRQDRGPAHVDVSGPERPRRMIDVNAEMVRAHRSLEQASPQEQRAEPWIHEESQDHRSCPPAVSKPLWSLLLARL